jgi:phage terminase small subunit
MAKAGKDKKKVSKYDSRKSAFKFDDITAELTDRQRLFCMEYVKCKFNGSQAARNAGYEERSAGQQAERLLKNDEIIKYINLVKNDLGLRVGISAEMIAKELANIGFSNISETLTVDGALSQVKSMDKDVSSAISSIKITQDTDRETGESTGQLVEIKLWDKPKALVTLNAMLGYNAPIKAANTDKDGNNLPSHDYSNLSERELNTLIELHAKASKV